MSEDLTTHSLDPLDDYSSDNILHDMLDNVLLQAMFLDQVLEIIDNGIVLFDQDGKLTVANDATKEILGYTDKELVGLSLFDLLKILVGKKDKNLAKRILDSQKKIELTVASKEGETLHLMVGARELKNERDEFAGHAVSLTNNTEQKNLQHALSEKNKTLSKIATRDALTGIFNRLYFEDVLAQKMLETNRYGTPLALAMIDIDHFKIFNDTHGHLAGDEVLRVVAKVMANSCRKSDIATRYGGEEFALILTGLPKNQNTGSIADRVRKAVEETVVDFNGKPLRVTISVGVADFDVKRHPTKEDLIKDADVALYAAKEKGRNQVVMAE